jgi:hypothetical protein
MMLGSRMLSASFSAAPPAPSPPGDTWTYTNLNTATGGTWPANEHVKHATWSGQNYIVSSDFGRIATSPDGAVWTIRPDSYFFPFSATLTAPALLTVDSVVYRATLSSTSSQIVKSLDHGVSWQPMVTIDDGNLQQMVLVNNAFNTGDTRGIAVFPRDSAPQMFSLDGSQTYTMNSVTANNAADWNGSKILVGHWFGSVSVNNSPGTYFSNWTTTSLTSIGWSGQVFDVAWGENFWVAVGSGARIATSPDGITWTLRSGPSLQLGVDPNWGSGNDCNGVVWCGDRFLVTGDGGLIATSMDGINWTATKSLQNAGWGTSSSNYAWKPVWNGSSVIVPGQNARVAISP